MQFPPSWLVRQGIKHLVQLLRSDVPHHAANPITDLPREAIRACSGAPVAAALPLPLFVTARPSSLSALVPRLPLSALALPRRAAALPAELEKRDCSQAIGVQQEHAVSMIAPQSALPHLLVSRW